MPDASARVGDQWPGPRGEAEDAIVELAELVREAADKLEGVDPSLPRTVRVRATSLAVKGVTGLGELMR
jgi:hypothetical protein